MAASARLMILMSPEERASLDAKARTLGVSAGEVVRRAVQAFVTEAVEGGVERHCLVDAKLQALIDRYLVTCRIGDELNTLLFRSTQSRKTYIPISARLSDGISGMNARLATMLSGAKA